MASGRWSISSARPSVERRFYRRQSMAQSDAFALLRGKHVHIDSKRRVPVQIDGDAAGHTPVNIDLLPIRLPFIVPE